MVKAPSRGHGLDRKFRSWRKGKSAKANKQGSLKHQLRGQERLLTKFQRSDTKDDTKIQELQQSIANLKAQITEKEQQEQQREHAKKSHGTRFLERQRLTRLERTARKSNDQTELLRIAMDQIYVAHYPLEKSYRPLFRNSKRNLQHSVSRAQLRNDILQKLNQKTIPVAKWIPEDQYQKLPDSWSVQQEVELFDYPTMDKSGDNNNNKKKKAKKQDTKEDNRFALQSNHEAILQAAQELESKLEKEEAKEEGADSDSSDSSSDDSSDSSDDEKEDGKPKATTTAAATTTTSNSKDSDSTSSDSDSSSDSELDQDPQDDKKPSPTIAAKRDSSTMDTTTKNNNDVDSDEDDGFLVPANQEDEDVNVFDRIKDSRDHMLPAENPARGDKSQGWATQQQRPGKFKKKRTRR